MQVQNFSRPTLGYQRQSGTDSDVTKERRSFFIN